MNNSLEYYHETQALYSLDIYQLATSIEINYEMNYECLHRGDNRMQLFKYNLYN